MITNSIPKEIIKKSQLDYIHSSCDFLFNYTQRKVTLFNNNNNKITKYMFGNVIAVAFQNIFHAEIYQNNFFYF